VAGFADIATALNNIAANLGRLIAQTALQVIVPITQGGTGATTVQGALTNLGLYPNLAAGQSGTAGVIDIFPSTAARGKTEFSAADNSGNTTTTIRTAAQAGARTYTVPDEGASASFLLTAASLGATGLIATPLLLLGFKNADGTTLAAAASSGKFGISVTAGTSEALTGETATSNTKTDTCAVEVVLPPWYIAGQNITLTANCNYTLSGGGPVIGTHTLAAAAYLTANNGTQGANLIATAAQTVPNAAGDVTFTITGATLSPSSRLWLTLTLVIQETGGGNAVGQINSVRTS
jgi:hypothetical protein